MGYPTDLVLKMIRKIGYGKKDGSRKGAKSGGKSRNTAPTCRHPKKRK